ncbi:SAM-dependent methyltransferase (plasmid) [Paenibacillus rhizovicinus]|uniref:SAM-dependent methyltransferase n=2 Tax=Paenibacillus rhizovicinus TaxID=2704463 RepID=A0A6C0PAG9_9BACL|nr:SAM-dependent methyltransferase [Paenibacillus rhizovicinus]
MSADNMKGMFDRIIRNKVRMGNFETTDQDMLSIRSLLQFPAGPFSVADFCAGSGHPLELLLEESSGVGFAIEPNEQKYLELRSRIPFALFGGYEQCRISRDTFRLMYLNPPYDTDSETVDAKVERKEKRFLRHLMQYVAVDGILVYNIPRGRMTKDIVAMLVSNLDDIHVFQSHDDTYHQVYAIGRKRKEKFHDRDAVQRILDLMEEGSSLERLPIQGEPLFKVLAGNVNPKYFRSSHMDVDQVCEVSVNSQLTKRGMEWTTPKKPAARLQPLLPDKEMHRVLRMASGRLNGKVGRGPMLHVLKGIVKKEISQTVLEQRNETIITDTEIFKITFKTVDRLGIIRTLQG